MDSGSLEASSRPSRWEWRGWLFGLASLSIMIAVVTATPPLPSPAQSKAAADWLPPPSSAAPPQPLSMELAPISKDDAVAQNAQVAIITNGFRTAEPFHFSGAVDAQARATDCLAAAMLYEAGDDARGQYAVAQVVINRARHPAFPQSICAVVFQGSERSTGCQFTFTCDGALARRYSAALWNRATDRAKQMLAGKVASEVGLATHYHTNWVRPYWSSGLDKIAAVDTHLFFRWPGYWGTAAAFRRPISGQEAMIAKLAAIAPAHHGLTPLDNDHLPLDEDAASAAKEARILAANSQKSSGETFMVQLDARAPAESHLNHALRLCGQRHYCKFLGWTNPLLKPQHEAMNDLQRAGMSFSYLRDDLAQFEKALWNCEEFPRDDKRLCMKR